MTAVIERDFISGLQVLRLSINFSITDHAIRRMLLSSSYKAKRKVSGKKKHFNSMLFCLNSTYIDVVCFKK